MNNKNSGPTLYFSQFGGERPIPEQFIAAMNRAEERTKVPIDFPLPEPSDEIIEARFDTRYENTNEKWLVVIKKKAGRVGPLFDRRTTDQGQSVQVTSMMFRTADETYEIASDGPTQDVSVKDLGNGWSIEEVAKEGSWVNGQFVPSIYQGVELVTRRPDPMPERFRPAAKVTQIESVVEGTVVQPTLQPNDLEARERQIAAHKKVLTRLTREGLTLPIVLISKRTNDKKQLVIVTDTYRVIGTAPVLNATKDVQVLDIGEGHEVVTTEEIAQVFGGELYSKEINDLLPPRFRGIVPTTVFRQILQGTAGEPTLGPGELRRSEQQITILTKLVEVMSRAGVEFPIEVIDTAVITQYGGGKVTITSQINVVDTYTVDEGEGIVDSKITKLGEGHELNETIARVAGAWPTRLFARWVPRLQMFITGSRQVVGKGSTTGGLTGSVVTEVEIVDGYREDKVISTLPLSAVDSYVRVLYGNNTNVNVPPELVELRGYIDLNGGAGSYNENGAYAISNGGGNGGIQLRGSAEANASAIPELGWVVKIPRTNNIPCIHVIFYVANGTSRSDIVTAVGTHLSAAMNDWPDFRPQPIVAVMFGGKINMSVQVNVSAHDAITTDYLGASKYTAYSRSSGAGISQDASRLTKTMHIPETIHGALTIVGQSDEWTSIYVARAVINGGTNGAIVDSQNVECASRGIIQLVSSSSATPGANQSIPTSGLHVHRMVTELDPEFPRTRVLAEVVNFADIAP